MTSPYPFPETEESEGKNWMTEQTNRLSSFTFWITKIQQCLKQIPTTENFHSAEGIIVQTWMRTSFCEHSHLFLHVWIFQFKIFQHLKRIVDQPALVWEAKGFLKATLLRKCSLLSPVVSSLLIPQEHDFQLTHKRHYLWRYISIYNNISVYQQQIC